MDRLWDSLQTLGVAAVGGTVAWFLGTLLKHDRMLVRHDERLRALEHEG